MMGTSLRCKRVVDSVYLRTGGARLAGTISQTMTRLYVVVSKAVSEDIIIRLFRAFPGLEYCDLKRDHTTGHSRVSLPSGNMIL